MPGNKYNRYGRGQASAAATANLRRQIRQVQRDSGLMLKVGPTSGDPPTISNNGRFIDRIIVIPGEVMDTLTVGVISQALENTTGVNTKATGPVGDFYILKIQLWGAGSLDSRITAKFHPNRLMINAAAIQGASDGVDVVDYGTGSRRAGIKCHIPASNAFLQDFNTGSTNIVVSNIYSGSGSNAVAGWGVCHITVRQKL